MDRKIPPVRAQRLTRRAFAAGAAALAATPFAAQAQAPGKTYRVAVWDPGNSLEQQVERVGYRAFIEELSRIGFVEKRNLIVERYATEGRSERYEPTARAIIDSRPDLVVSNSTAPGRLYLRLRTTIPLVLATISDPVATGLASSLARPGGYLTGFTLDGGLEINSLRLQLLKEAAPQTLRIAYLGSRDTFVDALSSILHEAAKRIGVELVVHPMSDKFDADGYRAVFAEFARMGVDALYLSPAAEHFPNRKTIIDLVAQARLPAIYPNREWVDEGGLMGYGANTADNWRKTAGYVARILSGDKPGDLPIQQPTLFDCVVNLKTAKALGLTLPETIFFRATEVIE